MEKLIIDNFGPLKHVEIDIKRINVFIGTTSSGKSTVAKLITILKSNQLKRNLNLSTFRQLLNDYNIDFPFFSNTSIFFKTDIFYIKITSEKIDSDYPFEKAVRLLDRIFSYANHSSKKTKTKEFSFELMHPEEFEDFYFEIQKHLEKFSEEEKARIQDLFQDLISISNDQRSNQIMYKTNLELLLKILNLNVYTPVYIPAERSFFATISESIFGLISNNISVPKCLIDFAAQFEVARRRLKEMMVPFLEIEYRNVDSQDFIYMSEVKGQIRLSQASSGIQSAIPLLAVITDLTSEPKLIQDHFVIEEPELNLYPVSQKDLLEYIMEMILTSGDLLTITTHSPYLLTALDNLIQAGNVGRKSKDKSIKNQVDEIIPKELWVSYNDVSCYYFNEGISRSTLDKKLHSIGPSNIDDVSIELGETFDKLLELKYK